MEGGGCVTGEQVSGPNFLVKDCHGVPGTGYSRYATRPIPRVVTVEIESQRHHVCLSLFALLLYVLWKYRQLFMAVVIQILSSPTRS